MQSLFKAIYNKISGDADLSAALTGGARLAEMPEGAAMPYMVFDLISNAPDFTFSQTIERARIQFTIVADSLEELSECAEKVRACFDDATLTFHDVDYKTVGLVRENSNQIISEDFYVYTIDYRMLICTL